MPSVPGFFRTLPTLRTRVSQPPRSRSSRNQNGQTLRLAVALSFGQGTVDGHHIRMSVHNAISRFAAEGAITPDGDDHAMLESWSVTVAPAEEA